MEEESKLKRRRINHRTHFPVTELTGFFRYNPIWCMIFYQSIIFSRALTCDGFWCWGKNFMTFYPSRRSFHFRWVFITLPEENWKTFEMTRVCLAELRARKGILLPFFYRKCVNWEVLWAMDIYYWLFQVAPCGKLFLEWNNWASVRWDHSHASEAFLNGIISFRLTL